MTLLVSDPFKRFEIYKEYLRKILGAEFTIREIDVLSCLLQNRGDKKIGSILGISYRTVNTHVRNILTKIQKHSRDCIIDTIEEAGLVKHLKNYYFHLLVQNSFEKHLMNIARLVNIRKLNYQFFSRNIESSDKQTTNLIVKHLELSRILLSSGEVDINFRINILDQSEEEYSKNSQTNIYLTFDTNQTNSQIENQNLIDFSDSSMYYKAMRRLIEEILGSNNVEAIFLSFDKEYSQLCHSYEIDGSNLIDIFDKPTSEATFLIKNKVPILLVLALCLSLSVFFLCYEKHPSKDLMIAEFADFAEKFSSENITRKMNSRFIDFETRINKLIRYTEVEKDKKYYKDLHITQREISDYLYCLLVLSTHYSYNQHDGSKSQEILLYAKEITEHYVQSKSYIKIDFDKLSALEIYSEMEMAEDIPELYTRIMYSLGRSYVYLHDIDSSKKYFELSKILGYKLGLLEGFLSVRSGSEVIRRSEIDECINNKNYIQSKENLLSSIEVFDNLRSDDSIYKVNYRSSSKHYRTIKPSEDLYNYVFCSDQMVRAYVKLILISEGAKEIDKYVDCITVQFIGSKDFSGILPIIDEIPTKRSAYIYNILANILLKFYELNIKCEKLTTFIKRKLSIIDEDNFFLIEKLFILAKEKSRSIDFTKADAYEGLIMLYELQIKQSNSQSQVEDLKSKITALVQKKDNINKALNRTSTKYF